LTYTKSVTKTKAADYVHIKWIEDLVPRTMWIQEPINYDKHALWGVSHWGRKRQQFYGFIVNRESALDVYSKRRIIEVTDLNIDVYKEYRHPAACGRSLTGSRKLPEDAQPYQARHDKKNRLMRIDELHKFNDGTLNDVRNALDDRLKGLGCTWKGLWEDDYMRETSRCCKGPYDSSYAAPIFTEPEFKGENPEPEVYVSPSSTLEDITYSDDEEDACAEADFTNLETNITVSPIPTTRVHKDHHVTQIIGDLSSATQTRSMTRVVKDQVGLTQINNEDVGP
nr:hypothetical protein [Tanacetum cinerariifolium]